MYVRSAAGGLAAFSATTVFAPDELAVRIARVLLEITGAGFWLYCLAALMTVLWRFRLRSGERD